MGHVGELAATSTTRSAVSAWPEFIIVIVGKVGNLGIGSIACCSCDLIIEFLGATATDAVCDEGDEDSKDDKANDGEDACYCACVFEESRKSKMKEGWLVRGRSVVEGAWDLPFAVAIRSVG